MKPIHFLRNLALLLTVSLVVGCKSPAQIDWSPDRSRAVYANPQAGSTIVIDDQGKTLASLGASVGGFAWSADSTVLYFATVTSPHTAAAAAPFHRNDNWLDGAMTLNPATPTDSSPGELTVSRLKGETQTPLFHIAAQAVWYLTLSGDGKWLAIVTRLPTEQSGLSSASSTQSTQLFVFSLASQTLYPLSDGCGIGICFTGPNRLAYIKSNGADLNHTTGAVVEVTLDESSTQLVRTPVLSVLTDEMTWFEARGDDILMTTRSGNFPTTAPSTVPPDDAYDLYLWHRHDGALTRLAARVGFLFLPSPDGARILFEKITQPNIKEMAVMNADGSGVQILQDISRFNGFPPMPPAWRGNDELTFLADPPAATQPAPSTEPAAPGFDVVLYHIGAKGLQPLRTLSAAWNDSLKPHDIK